MKTGGGVLKETLAWYGLMKMFKRFQFKYSLIRMFHSRFFFSIWVFFHNHSRNTGLQKKGESISLTPHYHFHSLHRHLDISSAITTESSPLHRSSSWNQTGNLCFRVQVANHLSYVPLINVSKKLPFLYWPNRTR